jgi:hypothetical protein
LVDPEKFFDRVNHDKLMAKIAERVGDKVLDEFDRELEQRGLRFAIYADDCNVRSKRAGERVMERMAEELTRYFRGWIGCFGKCETPSVLESLERWARRRLRSAIWRQ